MSNKIRQMKEREIHSKKGGVKIKVKVGKGKKKVKEDKGNEPKE